MRLANEAVVQRRDSWSESVLEKSPRSGPATKSKPAAHHCNDERVGEFLSNAFASGYARLCDKAIPGDFQEKLSDTLSTEPDKRLNGPE